MADYWISRDKYFCKYCKIYIADDKPSRIQHETGLRHKGNYERYIRDIYKRGARDQKDKVEEAKEIARIDAAAKAAMGIVDDAEPSAEPVASTSKGTAAPPTAPKPADPFANYTTAESLGYKDEVAAKATEEKELRQKEGLIGEWQKVAKRPASSPRRAAPPTGGIMPVGSLPTRGTVSGVDTVKTEEGADTKPPAASFAITYESDEQAEQKRKGYFTEKWYNPDEDDFDPSKLGSGEIKLKRKRLTLKEEEALEKERREREEALVPILAIGERRTGRSSSGWASADITAEPMLEFEEIKPDIKREEGDGDAKPSLSGTAQTEAESAATTSVGTGFKKRKMHGAGTVRKK